MDLTDFSTVRYTSSQILLISGRRGFILNNWVRFSRPSRNSANIMLAKTTSVATESGKFSFRIATNSPLCSSNFVGSLRVTAQITGFSPTILGRVFNKLALLSCPCNVSASRAQTTTISHMAMAIAECLAVLSWNEKEFLETFKPGTSIMSTLPRLWVQGVSIFNTSLAGVSSFCFKSSCRLDGYSGSPSSIVTAVLGQLRTNITEFVPIPAAVGSACVPMRWLTMVDLPQDSTPTTATRTLSLSLVRRSFHLATSSSICCG
mmetsp:Transcript_124983/g.216692  ORF Transcript_124983/g.216692 Transcript_124983/m.216692 type:complete len:262 (-) Transcript_124983:482-1267(-)